MQRNGEEGEDQKEANEKQKPRPPIPPSAGVQNSPTHFKDQIN